MYNIISTTSLNDLFTEYKNRSNKGAYLIRSFSYGKNIESFLKQLVANRNKYNTLFIDKLNNPDEKQLDYYETILGMEFSNNRAFFENAFNKWLSNLNINQKNTLIDSMEETFNMLLKSGKTESILKNIYVKFMCWFYYRLGSTLSSLGNDNFPKIVYTGSISNHELLFMHLLAESGCDIVLLIQDKESYKKADSSNSLAYLYEDSEKLPFPENFSSSYILNKLNQTNTLNNAGAVRNTGAVSQTTVTDNTNQTTSNTRITIPHNVPVINTNAWLYPSGATSSSTIANPIDLLNAYITPESQRGSDDFIYNLFIRIQGVWSKTTCKKDLFAWQKKLTQNGRIIIEINKLDVPSIQETQNIPRFNITSKEDIIAGLYPVLRKTQVPRLNNIIYKAFYDVIMNDDEDKLNRLNNKAIYITLWFNRFIDRLYSKYRDDNNMPVFIYFGGAKTNFECMFLKFLSHMLCDILIFCPSSEDKCMLDDSRLFTKHFDEFLEINELPKSPDDAVVGTVAYHAEQELTDVLYDNSGMYRQRQYPHADTVKLQTMLEEINMLWHETGTFRPGFETMDNTVILPVIAAKINGIKNGNKKQYWENIKKKLGDDTLLIKSVPYIRNNNTSIFKANEVIRNGKLLKDVIQSSPKYKYRILRNETQEHIFNKIQLLLDSKIIKGTFSQGMEYRIVNLLLNLNKDIIRLIQKFDFTKDIPKVVVLAFSESSCSVDDAILLAFLHFLGFDIVIYAPTGYQVIETYYSEPLFVDYQAGEYDYDMKEDDIDKSFIGQDILSRIFRRN